VASIDIITVIIIIIIQWRPQSDYITNVIIVRIVGFTDLNLYCIKGVLALFVLVSFLATCARWSWILSFRVHVKPLYRIIS